MQDTHGDKQMWGVWTRPAPLTFSDGPAPVRPSSDRAVWLAFADPGSPYQPVDLPACG
jgi:hypothetical protein